MVNLRNSSSVTTSTASRPSHLVSGVLSPSRPRSKKYRLFWRNRFIGALTGLFASSALVCAGASFASAETRALDIYHMHTGEHQNIIFKRDGVYDQQGLSELNHILRDWRRNETIKMDPALFDLIWEVYRDAGATQPIQIVCGYRAPETNNMLRARSRGVAKFSQHTLGKAMDFFLPGVPLAKLREIGMKQQVGGVGFYPTSGSPFVHMDTGGVRAWPRMTHDQLVRLFPDGKTLHLPADGGPLPGYDQALAEYQRRQSGQSSMVASRQSSGNGNVLAALFGIKSGEDDETETASAKPQPAATRSLPAAQPPAQQASTILTPPVPPLQQPSNKPVVMASLPLPQERPSRYAPAQPLTVATASTATGMPVPSPTSSTAPHLASRMPVGWAVGPSSVAASAPEPTSNGPDATQIAALKAIGLPVPTAKPQSVIGAMPKPRPAMATASLAPRSIQDAFSALTGTPRDTQSDSLLGYAPVATPLAGTEPRATSVSRDQSARLQLASLAPIEAVLTSPPANYTMGKQARSAPGALAKSDRGDPMARLVSHVSEGIDVRLFDTNRTERSALLATFVHPDQDTMPQMIVKPTEMVIATFDRLPSKLSTDRFAGPAVVALAVVDIH